MVKILKKIVVVLLSLIVLLSTCAFLTSAQEVTPTPTPTDTNNTSQQAQDLQKQIQELQGKITGLQSQEKTLSSQIEVMDSQIKLTELRINATQQQITDLVLDIDTTTGKINSLEGSLDGLTKVLLGRIVATYEVGSIQPFQILMTSSNVSDFFKRENYLKIAQQHDKRLVYDTVQAKNDYANQKAILEDKKKQIEALKAQLLTYTDQLNQEKAQKKQLLADTQGSEANYQSQLRSLQAQLSALAGFANARSGGGAASIIPHSDMSDGWGKYYNQRDANWGNNFIGYSSEKVWEVGCLLTSYAMVSTHFGSNVTPGDVAATSDYFALGTAFFRQPGPAPSGHSVSYVTNPSISQLQDEVKAGNPVIAGMSANGGPYPSHYSDHWIVLRGVDGSGNFIINDPWYQGAMSAMFSDHYAGWTIIEARIYH